MPEVKTHPVIEAVAKKLSGIRYVLDKAEQARMVERACSIAAKMYDDQHAQFYTDLVELVEAVGEECYDEAVMDLISALGAKYAPEETSDDDS